ncbi:MAG: DUF881 domain-containing protein [Eubacteriaceae bacterium]|jgi:uncharacterized protein YlxW (UPF0749 family)|nr:DUF881 domain-containing protein [Eubacteriaceae bacterium]
MNKGKWSITLVCIIFGIMIALQVKAIDNVNNRLTVEQDPDVLEQMVVLEEENEKLREENSALQEQYEKIEQAVIGDNAYLKEIKQMIDKERTIAGMTDLEGRGLVINMNPSEMALNERSQIQSAVLLLTLNNELNAAGAEAISINGERIINRTEIRQVGSYVQINGKKYNYPFEIRVIGDPDTLYNAITMPSGVVDLLKVNTFKVRIEKKDDIKIEGYKGNVEVQYAMPVENIDYEEEAY